MTQIVLHSDGKKEEEARRFVEICNSCRYCEGYCAVFPAIELRRYFSSGDLTYLANLCHDCRGCYYSCQYAPPHEFALNLPKAFAEIRRETYERYAWPRPLASIFRRNGVVAAILALACTVLFLLVKTPYTPGTAIGAPRAFYAVVPEVTMIGITGASFAFAILACSVGLFNFWRDTKSGSVDASSFSSAFGDVLTLRNLGGGGDGCNVKDEAFSQTRRYFHHSLFYGFLLCFASTCTAAFYEHVLGRVSPYPLNSIPVLLGATGGVAMLIGIAGLVQIKLTADSAPVSRLLLDLDYCFLVLLFVADATGLLLLMLRATSAMSIFLALHLGVIVAVFLMLPYCKFVHGLYRAAALVRSAVERPRHAQAAIEVKQSADA